MKLNRREFLLAGAAACSLPVAGCRTLAARRPPIIDCHTHFYDPQRPQGVPWPPRSEARLYRPVYPQDYQRLAVPQGVTGTVVVEASEWIEDNQWVLDLAAREPFIVGLLGNVALDDPQFETHIRRFSRNPLFRGIRVRGSLTRKVNEPALLRNLEFLAFADLALDYNAGIEGLPIVAQLATKISTLRIIINHVANLRIDGQAPPAEWVEGMKAAAGGVNVFLKISGLVEGSRRNDGTAPREVDFYRPVLDAAWDIFGEDRLIYGSNWPVSELYADFATVHGIIRDCLAGRSKAVARKVFAENSRKAYKWIER